MELQHHKFGYAGNDMNFAVFSDDPCRVSYVESIAIPIGHTQVELYGIEPGARTKWIVVKQLDGHKATLKVFLRQNEKFLENQIDDLPQETRSQSSATGEKQHIGMSQEQEVAMGLQAAPQMADQFGGLHPDSNIQNKVQEIGTRLVQQSVAGPVPTSFPSMS